MPKRIISEETRKKMSEARKGKVGYWKGKKRPPRSKEWNDKLIKYLRSDNWLGKKRSLEDREKMRIAHLGQKSWNKNKKCPQLSDKNHWNWKGDKVGYFALHTWIQRKKGKAVKCKHCGKEKTTPRSIQWANINHKYSRKLRDYISLCVSCHRKFDYKYNNRAKGRRKYDK